MADQSIALQVKPLDVLTPLEQVTKIQAMRASTAKVEQDTDREAKKFRAQDSYADAVRLGDKNAMVNSGIMAHSEAYKTTADALATADHNTRAQMVHKFDVLGRVAEGVRQAAPKDRPKEWDKQVDFLKENGIIDDKTSAQFKGKYNELTLYQIRAASMAAKEHMEASGEAAGRRGETTLPADQVRAQSHPQTYQPGTQGITIPNRAMGMPPAQSRVPYSPGERAAGAGLPGAGGDGSTPQPAAPGSTPPAASGQGGQRGPSQWANDPLYAQIPVVGPGTTQNKGDIISGRTPEQLHAATEAQKEYDETIKPHAVDANTTRSQLGTMRAQLQSGDMNSSALAPALATVGAWIYASVGGGERGLAAAKAMTGIDPSKSEVFNKESTRMSLLFARQTEGARQAVQAIQIALGANPSFHNTKEGNLKIIDVMDTMAAYAQSKDKAAQMWSEKNGGNLQGFSTWYERSFPLAQQVSKIVPYEVPTWTQRKKGGGEEHIWDAAKLENGVTYNVPTDYKTNDKGKVIDRITQPMVWDKEKNAFISEQR